MWASIMLYGMNQIMNSEDVNLWLGEEGNLYVSPLGLICRGRSALTQKAAIL